MPLATDGAPVMMGQKTGVGVQVKSKYAPYMTQTHCIAHRLNLAASDAIKKDKSLEKFRDKFNALYVFISGSSICTEHLKKMQELLNEPEISIKEPHSIRWLGLRNAVNAVYSSYNSVCATLSFAAENATASGLLKYFTNYTIVLLVAFMLDIHDELGILSKELQKQAIISSEVESLLDDTLGKLEYFKKNDGMCLKDMKACKEIKEEEDGKKFAYLNGGKLLTYKETVDCEFEKLKKVTFLAFRKI